MIVLASVIFSVQTVVARCRNDLDDEALSAEVVAAAGIPFTSIFMLDEDAVIRRVNEKVLYAEMINVERVFPNKVNLNYNKLYEDIRFESGGESYVASASGRILKKGQASADTVVNVKLGAAPISVAVGTHFNSSDSADMIALDTLINGLENLGDSTQAFDKGLYSEIDLTGNLRAASGIIMHDIIVTTKSGVRFDLLSNSETGAQADADKIFSQLRVAISMYTSGKFSILSGRYIVAYNHNNTGFYSAS